MTVRLLLLLLLASWTVDGVPCVGNPAWKLLCEAANFGLTDPKDDGGSKSGKVTRDATPVSQTITETHRKVSHSTERSRFSSPAKIQKTKKDPPRNRVPNEPTKISQESSKKEGKSPVVNVKLLGDSEPAKTEGTKSLSRQHKAFFVNYPSVQRVYQDKDAKAPGRKKQKEKEKQKPKHKPTKQKQRPDSEIYFIRLPPTPYSYVPGLGYISQPPQFSTASLARPRPKPQNNPFINLPIEFVSNGKPTGVYKWQNKHQHHDHKHHQHQDKNQRDSPIIRLNRGPYVFDGRPSGVYLMNKNSRPTPNLY